MSNEFEQQAAIAAEKMKEEAEKVAQAAAKAEAEARQSAAGALSHLKAEALQIEAKLLAMKAALVQPVEKVVVKVEDEIKSLKAEVKTVFAPDPTTVSNDHTSSFMEHLTQTLEAKKQELEDLLAKDADSAKKVAQNYIQSAIDDVQIEIAKEHFRLTSVEQKGKNYLQNNSDKISESLIVIAMTSLWVGIIVHHFSGLDATSVSLVSTLVMGVITSFTNPLWNSSIKNFLKSLITKKV